MSTSSKVALITDTHFGVRKGSQILHDYFEKFYKETFFPKIDELGINTIIHLGDCFDVRKTIDYWSLDWAKRVFFDPIQDRNLNLIMIVGNHDSFYKNSIKLNSPRINLREYFNINIIDSPQTISVNNQKIFMVPWICEENAEEFSKNLEDTDAKICMGHLELAGFYANKDYKCEHGIDPDNFNKFEQVFSGHFHKKSNKGNVSYLGNPYQMYWNDEGETRGFHIFDLDNNQLELIPNPNSMFHKIFYNENREVDDINPPDYINTYIKIIVEGKSTPVKLSRLVDKLYDNSVHDVKVIENFEVEVDENIDIESEDTLTTLTNYVNALENDINKENLVNIFKTLYVEAQEV